MSVSNLDAFKIELSAIKDAVLAINLKTVRDDQLRDRIRTLFRTWTSVVQPNIVPFLQEKREFLKLSAELEVLAKLTSKIKPVAEYRKRLNKAIGFANEIVLYLPPSSKEPFKPLRVTTVEKLFISGIPDLPSKLVPNSLLGWRRNLTAFIDEHPFDKSVFVMIKYRRHNIKLIGEIKKILKKSGFYGVLASEHKLTDDLYNPIACLLCCARGIAVFDKAEAYQTFNPNVAYELGMMHLLNRDCLILKHKSQKVLHTDILMKLYNEYNTIIQASQNVNDWIDSYNQ